MSLLTEVEAAQSDLASHSAPPKLNNQNKPHEPTGWSMTK